MKIFFLCFVIGLLYINCLYTNDINSNSDIKILTKYGIDKLLNFEIEEADKYFNDAIKISPSFPQAYINQSAIHLWKFLFSKDENDYNRALKLIDRAIKIAEKYSEENRKDAYALTSLGIAYGNRVFLKIRNENFLSAIFDLKKSYEAFNKAVKLDPNYYDAYLGLGIYHYSIGSLPKTLKGIISILGFEGDVEKGLREIELAAENGIWQNVEANFFLTQIYPWHMGDFVKAQQILNTLLSKYPNNQIFLYTQGVFYLNDNNVEEALKLFQSIENQKAHPIPKLLEYTRYRLGECNFRSGNYERALSYYQAFLKNYTEQTYLAQVCLNIGISYEFLNKRDQALIYYQKSGNSKSKYGDDLYAQERAKIFMERPISKFDSILIVARNFHKSGKFIDAVTLYEKLKQIDIPDVKKKAELIYYLGECLYDYQKYFEAREVFKKIFEIKLEKNSWFYPWSKFYLGQIELKLGKMDSAKKYFKEVFNYDDYMHERWLTYRTQRYLNLIK